MSSKPAEVTKFHSRLLRSSLDIESSRAYWKHAMPQKTGSQAKLAFEAYWFGSKSMARVQTLVRQFDWQFGAIPQAMQVLNLWKEIDADTRRLICHWHLQFSDPLYRAFSGTFLPDRIESGRSEVTKDLVVRWIESLNPGQWQTRTQMRIANNLFHASKEAGLIRSSRDPRTAISSAVTDLGLTYMVYLLREVQFEGTIMANPYFRSVGLENDSLESRLRSLGCIEFQKQGSLIEFGWKHETFAAWGSSIRLSNADQIREAS